MDAAPAAVETNQLLSDIHCLWSRIEIDILPILDIGVVYP